MNDADINEELSLVAKTIFGLEDVLAEELKKVGARDVEKHNRAVSFKGDLGTIYKCNLHLRTALRILIPIAKFEAANEYELYNVLSI